MPGDNPLQTAVLGEQLTELFNAARQLTEGDTVEFASEFEPRTITATEHDENIVLIDFVDPEDDAPSDDAHPIWCMNVATEDGRYVPEATLNDWDNPPAALITSIEIEEDDGQQRAVVDFNLE